MSFMFGPPNDPLDNVRKNARGGISHSQIVVSLPNSDRPTYHKITRDAGDLAVRISGDGRHVKINVPPEEYADVVVNRLPRTSPNRDLHAPSRRHGRRRRKAMRRREYSPELGGGFHFWNGVRIDGDGDNSNKFKFVGPLECSLDELIEYNMKYNHAYREQVKRMKRLAGKNWNSPHGDFGYD